MNPGQKIIDAIEAHRPYGLNCKCHTPINSDHGWALHFLASLHAAGIAVVQLIGEADDPAVWANQAGGVTLQHSTDGLVSNFTPQRAHTIGVALISAAEASGTAGQ